MAHFTNLYSVLADLSDRTDSSPDPPNRSTSSSTANHARNPPSAPLRSEAVVTPTPNELTERAHSPLAKDSIASKGEASGDNAVPDLTVASTASQTRNLTPNSLLRVQQWLLEAADSAAPADNRDADAPDTTQGTYAPSQLDGPASELAAQTMATANINFGDARRNLASPRPRGRENQKNIPCRNITIYGNCRYENEGCAFNHDRAALGGLPPANTNTQSVVFVGNQAVDGYKAYLASRTLRPRMNADSPAFTPTQTSPNGSQANLARSTTISPKAANAAVFTPKTNKSSKHALWEKMVMRSNAPYTMLGPLASTLQAREPQEFKPRSRDEVQPQIPAVQDFNQQAFDQSQMYQHDPNAVANMMASYDPFTNAAIQGMAHPQQQTQLNPYAQDLSAMAGPSNFYNHTTEFQQPVSQLFVFPLSRFDNRTRGPKRRGYGRRRPYDEHRRQFNEAKKICRKPPFIPRPEAPEFLPRQLLGIGTTSNANQAVPPTGPSPYSKAETMSIANPGRPWSCPCPYCVTTLQTSFPATVPSETSILAVPVPPFSPKGPENLGLDERIEHDTISRDLSPDTSSFENVLLTPQQIQYHLYAPIGSDRTRLEGYQRLVHNLFMPNDLREDLQKKAEATLRVLPTSNLPAAIAHFQSLYPLDTSATKNASLYGYPTSIYKAKSSQDGRYYALRRVEGFRLEREEAIRSVQKWKTVRSASLVSIQEAFTTRDFGDSSLILITDYHPNSKTLQEVHFSSPARTGSARSQSASYVGEHVLWSYIVQIAHALKAIHSAGLAARVIAPSKILQTSKNRIRLNGCCIVDIVQYDTLKPALEAQQDDFVQFGKLLLAVASANANASLNIEKALTNLSRSTYSAPLKQTIAWLLAPAPSPNQYGGQDGGVQGAYAKDIDTLLRDISAQSTRVLESSLSENDQLLSALSSELENGRLVRILAKLNCITERPEFEHNPQWSETGDRYYLKLFRDYVFHQVDSEGRPVVDLGWIVSCLNKLDAGSEEKIALVSRDEQVIFVVSYREVKKAVESAFNELLRAGGGGRR